MSRLLETLDLPRELATLSDAQCEQLAAEIREFLVARISRTGGHLGSNLGMVELTIALHRVYRSPQDRLIFDVGHQAYIHKILTGRAEGFSRLRQYGGLSGFPKRAESSHDHFDTGHSSTSISAALGFAIAMRQERERREAERNKPLPEHDVVCVIGDGALTGGMAFEALNHLGASGEKVTVVLNDNQMSISRNVGGMVGALRTSPNYESLKKGTRSILSKIPWFGPAMIRGIERFKDGVKAAVIRDGVFFEELGLTYIGPIDGHDLKRLHEHFEYAKKVKGPVILHVHTVKGKGYPFAEQAPELYHGVGRFDPAVPLTPKKSYDFSSVFGAALERLAEKDPRVQAISAAMIDGTGLARFAARFPGRTHDVAIAEQHAVTMSAAMALAGLRPYTAIYSTFLQRAFDQIIHDVCIQKAEVIFCVDRAGLVGNDGETHHGYFDVGYLSILPNMTILTAATREDLEEMLEYSIAHRGGPLAIRYPRGIALTDSESGLTQKANGFGPYLAVGELGFRIGGIRVVVVTSGKMTHIAKQMSEASFESRLPIIVLRKLCPLDEADLAALVADADLLITVDDHMEKGGIADVVRRSLPIKSVRPIGYPDFVTHGDTEDLLRALRMDADGLAQRVRELCESHELKAVASYAPDAGAPV